MATYIIGDIQGCYEELTALLEKIGFTPATDKLIFVGDLVNRGPKSLETLRTIKAMGASAATVLGNHDLYLLHIVYRQGERSNKDTLDDLLAAPDKIDLIEWLRHQPLAIQFDNHLITHAGMPPQWSLGKVTKKARELESILRSSICAHIFLANLFGNEPGKWNKFLEGPGRWRCIANHLTRMRFCRPDGSLVLNASGGLDMASPTLIPWFRHADSRIPADLNVYFGHWAALQGETGADNIIALDTGCVWGNHLTAYCIDNQSRYSVPAAACYA